MSRARDRLLAEIAREEARLAQLELERERTSERMKALRERLDATSSRAEPPDRLPLPTTSVPTAPLEKVALFRALFRGREDVFPTRFESKRTGKAGYAPACANKFVRGVCDLPRVRCSECPNQAFLAADEQAILGHLRGRHVMGLYPLIEDETCWLLAADFDKASWMDDVSAFVEATRSVGAPVCVERSRSGNGAHAWFFFSAPVAASVARRMGCYLITINSISQRGARREPRPNGAGPPDAPAARPGTAKGLGEGRASDRRALRLRDQGEVEQVGPGLFRHPDAAITEKHTYAEAAKLVPSGVACLLSALAFHEIGTQMPREVWMALRAHSKRPTVSVVPLRILWFSGDALTEGIETHTVEGVEVKVYGPAKTIADLFKFRSKVGVDVAVAVEALRDAWSRRLVTMQEVLQFAKVCRVENVMRPYLEAIIS